MLLSACTPPVFPYKVLEGINSNFDFAQWRTHPNQPEQQKIQLGGRILHADTRGGTLRIVTAQLPIAKQPYGPEETGKSSGEFVILYRAVVDPLFLQTGNRVMVVGQTSPPTQVEVDNRLRSLPTVTAQCIHFWNTSDKDIVVHGSPGAGSKALRELTYCKTAL